MFSFPNIQRRDRTAAVAYMEVSQSQLRIAITRAEITHGSSFDEIRSAHTLVDEIQWRVDSMSLLTESGWAELQAAFAKLCQRHELRGAEAIVALSGELCVSRIAGGAEAHVASEMDGFRSRCERYLSLGHGQKVQASRVENHGNGCRGVLSVANHSVVLAIDEAARNAGLRLKGIEPSVISLSRLMGKIAIDVDPLLLVGLDSQGVEFSLSHQGEALVQFRPAPGYRPEEAGEATRSNMSRLQRNCQRYAGSGSRFRQVHIIGGRDQVGSAIASLDAQGFSASSVNSRSDADDVPLEKPPGIEELEICVFDPEQLDWNIHSPHVSLDGRFAAVLGLATLAGRTQEGFGPDLLTAIEANHDDSWRSLLTKHWLTAAIVLLAVGLYGMSWFESQRVSFWTAQKNGHDLEHKLLATRLNIGRLRGIELKFEALRQRLSQDDLGVLMAQIAHCLPDPLWLTSMEMHLDGTVILRGETKAESSIYRAIASLRQSPTFDRLSLNTTTAADHFGLVDFELRGLRQMRVEGSNENN